jgi:hypothetical protein
LDRLPALTRFYGLTPMDVEQMTLNEVDEYLTYMAQATQDRGGGDNGT